MSDNHIIDAAVILSYLFLMAGIGWVFSRANNNVSDYFRSGSRGAWWMVGSSAFMSAFSAWTFTGAAGAAFNAGWTVMAIYIGGALGFFLNFICFAAWFRQLRVTTVPEAIGLRYDERTRVLYAVANVMLQVLGSGLTLYGLAIFCAAFFGFPVAGTICFVGLIVVFYSVSGGSWAVMATDYLQSVLLMAVTLLVGILCLVYFGGVGGFFDAIESSGLQKDFQFVDFNPNHAAGAFTIGWMLAVSAQNIISGNTIYGARRYFAAKDGREAAKAALFTCLLMLIGSWIWLVPPMTGRILFEQEILGYALTKPEEASYAFVSVKMLPTGLAALIVVAMFSATMSTLDTGLNANAAIIVLDLLPRISRRLKAKLDSPEQALRLSRWISFGLGVLVIASAVYFSQVEGKGMFELMLLLQTAFIPMMVPMFFGLLVRRVPRWSAMCTIIIGFAAGLIGYFEIPITGLSWTFQEKFFLTTTVSTIAFFATMPFWKNVSEADRRRTNEFFELMYRPVDFEKEIGGATDFSQLRILGRGAAVMAFFVVLLALLPNPLIDRLWILGLATVIGFVSVLMLWAARRLQPTALGKDLDNDN
ncbi:sodium:solute symporter family transporter [Cerasicoccus frondis]|uniref:sodium:solute symporter family transporter n=1 Tax=Cerasicoccus frondis TaxID=490090 RepID=UPI002852CA26|nr:hypothetical protein [Cerasicoccus frondis]